jgi:Protein of unknown function (DUF2726)
VDRGIGARPFFSKPLPDARWPVAARNLLTAREQELYQNLLAIYPGHKVFVQVALSQLIEVDHNHAESESVRARYKQLVADFVLCRSDLSVVAVIELDDRSHERADRQGADARKSKVLADAGIRLIRIPAGALPSEDALRRLVDADGEVRKRFQQEAVLRLAETVDTYSDEPAIASRRNNERAESRALKSSLLKVVFVGVVLIGGWLAYSQLLPSVMQWVFRPLAGRQVSASAPAVGLPTVSSQRIPVARVAVGSAAQDLAEMRWVEIQAAAAAKKERELAWAASYAAPASCEHPADWTAQVECGNRYMRAKKEFETRWAAEHGSRQGTGGAVVLDNQSAGVGRK